MNLSFSYYKLYCFQSLKCYPMIKCPRCGGFLGPTMRCRGCDFSLGEPAIIELHRQREYCPNCGAENHNYSMFCYRCQVQIHSDTQIDAVYSLVISRSLKERAYQAKLSGQNDIAKELLNYLKKYETLNILPDKFQHHRVPSVSIDKDALAIQSDTKGVSISYHCCYCGAILTLEGTSPDIPNYCPQCGVELDAIDFEKMIQNVLLG